METEIKVPLVSVGEVDLCRTCLSNNSLQPLFKQELTEQNYVDLAVVVATVTSLKIKKNDGLPEVICSKCKEHAISAYNFITISQETETKLRTCLTEKIPKIEKQVEEDNTIIEYPPWDDAGALSDDLDTNNEDVNVILVAKEVKIETKVKQDTENYCYICNQSFGSTQLFDKHMAKKHSGLILKRKATEIMRPKKGVVSKKKIVKAMLTPKGKEFLKKKNAERITVLVKCLFCVELFYTEEEMFNHYGEDHKDINAYRCSYCKDVFLDSDKFNKHLVSNVMDNNSCASEALLQPDSIPHEILSLHTFLPPADFAQTTEGVFMCSYCGCLKLSKTDLRNHIEDRHPDKSLQCKACSKEFVSMKSAQRHRLKCGKAAALSFQCSSCNAKFPAELSLNKHILSQHIGVNASVKFNDILRDQSGRIQWFECDVCTITYPTKIQLERHMSGHLHTIFECSFCKRKFNRKYNLWTHMRVHEKAIDVSESEAHTELLKLQQAPRPRIMLCKYCGRRFSNTSNLIVHERRHTGERPYKCDGCEKAFPRKCDLVIHRRIHTGEKPCACPICGRGFTRSNKLTRHMHTHTGQKPYKCTYCDKAFAQSNDLRVHVRRHTGDKPYYCEVCGDRFVQGYGLRSHRRSHGHFPPSTSVLPPSGYLPLPPAEVSNLPQNDF